MGYLFCWTHKKDENKQPQQTSWTPSCTRIFFFSYIFHWQENKFKLIVYPNISGHKNPTKVSLQLIFFGLSTLIHPHFTRLMPLPKHTRNQDLEGYIVQGNTTFQPCRCCMYNDCALSSSTMVENCLNQHTAALFLLADVLYPPNPTKTFGIMTKKKKSLFMFLIWLWI